MRIFHIFMLCLLAPVLWAADSQGLFQQKEAPRIIPAEQAFIPNVAQVSEGNIVIDFSIAPGTYLYQKAFKFSAPQTTFGQPLYPQGETVEDPFFGTVSIFRNNLVINLPVTATQNDSFELTVGYQGCNDIGICYPPQESKIMVHAGPINPSNQALHILQDMPMIWALAAFFGFGILLAFTPCVLPMVPILSALIIGEQYKHHRWHAFRLALTYVLAMATSYAALGATVASLGARVQAQLQHPVLLSITAGILIIMAILLFNDKALAFASKINQPLHKLADKMHAGKTWGVIAMGILSALIVSPCVTPPLIGALTYISLSGDVMMGASALFLLALGMGVPLLIVAWGGTALLPKKGPWLNYVKHAFAIILILMAASLLSRFIAPSWDWSQPFASTEKQSSHLPFVYIENSADLDKALNDAKAQGKPAMLDFYADWCTTCISIEKTVFTDAQVSAQLAQLVLLKVDVTDYNSGTQALMSQWQVYGPPALIFFNAQGQVQPHFRVDGPIKAPELSQRLDQLFNKQP